MRRLGHFRDRIATASVVWYELLYGCHLLPDSTRRHKMEKYVHEVVRRIMPILAYTAEAAAWHAAERVRLELLGHTPPYADSQIAAIAKVNGLVLVTNNVRDFERFEGLKIQNWFR
jgi:tRNA(fMet)-specific endonuclease VapC